MATVAPTHVRTSVRRLPSWFSETVKSAAPIFLGALIAALFTYYFTAKLNAETSLQQQYIASVQDFSSTGARVDAAVTYLADTTYDNTSRADAMKEARQAVASHAAATLGIEPLLGAGNVRAYMRGVADMRVLIDKTVDSQTAQQMAKGRMALLENRVAMIAAARKRIYD